MDSLFFIFLFALILFIGVPLGSPFLAYFLIKRKGWNKCLIYLSFIPIIVVGYLIYDAVFPSEDFYKEEFEIATDLNFPESGRLVFKSATYPDLQGSYSSIFCFESDSIFYQELQHKLDNIKDSIQVVHMSEFEEGKERIKERVLVKELTYSKNNVHYSVGFFSDNKTILIHRVKY